MEDQVQAFLADLEAQPAYASSTCQAYQNDLRSFLAYLRAQLQRPVTLADLTAQSVADFLQAERQKGKRPSTLMRRRASLRRFISFIGEHEPAWVEKFNREAHLIDEALSPVTPVAAASCLTDAQVDKLWAVMEVSPKPRARRDQAILALLLEIGLMVGTLTALNLHDIDLSAGTIHIPAEDPDGVWLKLGVAQAPLECYLKEGRPELNYQPGEPALFISQTGGRMSRQGVWQVLRQWGKKAGLPMTLSPRLIRHTAAYRLAQSDRSLQELQEILGHRSPLSTRALFRRLAINPDEEVEEES